MYPCCVMVDVISEVIVLKLALVSNLNLMKDYCEAHKACIFILTVCPQALCNFRMVKKGEKQYYLTSTLDGSRKIQELHESKGYMIRYKTI